MTAKIYGKRADTMILDDIEPNRTIPGGSIISGLMRDFKPNKFAPVAPYHIYRSMALNGYVPNVVLLLAHDVVAHKKEYEETFTESCWKDTHIIMDNSLVETGNAVDADMVLEAAEAVSADTVVLPDVMGDGFASANATLAAWHKWQWMFRDYKKMVVLHGTSVADWMGSAELLAKEIRPDIISLPRKLQGVEGRDRKWFIQFVHALFPAQMIHLLGFSDYIWADLEAAAHPKVISIDSAVPLRLTSNDILSEDAGERGNWWEEAEYERGMVERCARVDQLIYLLGAK